jgi:hypothetical protein
MNIKDTNENKIGKNAFGNYCHVLEWLQTGFELMIGFIAHLYSSWLHFTNHYYTQTSVLS